ncbi:14693_t:CDS:2, partial [Cetraspora pellucida]
CPRTSIGTSITSFTRRRVGPGPACVERWLCRGGIEGETDRCR